MPSNPPFQPTAPSQAISRRATTLWLALGRLGFIAESGILATVVAAVWLLLAPLGYAQAGTAGLVAAAVAAGVSLAAAQIALTIGHLFRGPAAPMYGMVAGMFARMSVALLVGVTLQRGMPALADAAMILYLLVFYLVTLFVETVMLVAKIRPDSFRPGPSLPKAV
jgi:hypothetical protein